MQELHKKHKATSPKLDEYKATFHEIRKEKEPKGFAYYPFVLSQIKALKDILYLMYEINDFDASSYAYFYVYPLLEKLIDKIMENMHIKDVNNWARAECKIEKVKNPDGSITELNNLGFAYVYLQDAILPISARYFIEPNIIFLEKNKSVKDFPSRKRILESFIWWVNQVTLGIFDLRMPSDSAKYDFIPQQVIFSTFPSSGKSYVCNTTNQIFSMLGSMIKGIGGCLRMGNEQSNIFRQSQQTKNMFENPLIFRIYPELKRFITATGKYSPFNKSSEEEWGLQGVYYDPATSIFKTRDSAINSVRCLLGIFDDPSRGMQEANNITVHKFINSLYVGDFDDRFKEQNKKAKILTGTMYNPFDVFATQITEALSDGYYVDERFRNTFISKDRKTIVILNDVEDEKGNSAYPEFISDADVKKKREGMEAYSYACTWRQKPIPAEGLLFDYDLLSQYDEISDTDLNDYAFAYIDPTRRNPRDYFCMPICRKHKTTGKFYIVDAIFVKKAARELISTIVSKIIEHKILKIVIEENTSSELGDLIKNELKKQGVDWCEIEFVYNTVNKQQRIADFAGTVKQLMRFPRKGKLGTKNPLGLLIYTLTQYSTSKSNLNDDAPDSLCGFIKHFSVDTKQKNIIKIGKRLPF